MSFGILSYSEDAFSAEGSSNLYVTLPSQSTLVLALGNVTITGDANVSVATYIERIQSELTPPLNAINLSFVVSAAFTPTFLLLIDAVLTLSTICTSTFTLPSILWTTGIVTVIVFGNVNIDLSTFLITSSLGTITISGTASITLGTILASGSVGTVTISGGANVDLTSLTATTSVGTVTVVGDANITLPSTSVSSVLDGNKIIVIALKAEGYARERTVYVDHRDNNISSTVQIPEEKRVIQIAEKKHEVVSKVLLAA